MKIIFFVLWFIWATIGWVAIYQHNKKHPGIFWQGLCFFAIFFGPMMIIESYHMEQRDKFIRGEITKEEYFNS